MLILTPLAFWLGEGAIEKALMISSLLLVLIVELINSAIESAIDRIGSETHELSGRAKDIGSAAVFLSLLNAAKIIDGETVTNNTSSNDLEARIANGKQDRHIIP